jgi:hypothetical protein
MVFFNRGTQNLPLNQLIKLQVAMHGHERHNMLAWVCVTHIVFLTFEMMMRGMKKQVQK